MKARAYYALVRFLLVGFGNGVAAVEGGACLPLPAVMSASGKPSSWSEKGTGEHVLDEATMAALCLGNHVAQVLIRAVQVENSCSVLCTPAWGRAYHVNITDGLSCGVEKVCIRTECRRQPSVTESDLCKSVHPNQASQASGYDECQFLCYVKHRATPYRYCRPPGTACIKWEARNVQRPGILHEQRVKRRRDGCQVPINECLASHYSILSAASANVV
ncbi:uncharacterized protein [Dermacentor albipictus]|uniref:uncharacterized protein isoform X1 n=1 Tax=Dermacentor albipictus TaxID=60249 RepID=UPI0031FCD5C4